MAIDTAEKRKSAAGVPFLPLGVNVTPNASKDAEWRQQSGWSYSGIPVSVVVTVAGGKVVVCVTYVPGAAKQKAYVPGAHDQAAYVPGAAQVEVVS